jgi:hypothetical protein
MNVSPFQFFQAMNRPLLPKRHWLLVRGNKKVSHVWIIAVGAILFLVGSISPVFPKDCDRRHIEMAKLCIDLLLSIESD